MNKINCSKCNKYRKFEKNLKYDVFLVISVAVKMKKYLKKKNQLRYQKCLASLKIFRSTKWIYNYFKNMVEENISQEFRLDTA